LHVFNLVLDDESACGDVTTGAWPGEDPDHFAGVPGR